MEKNFGKWSYAVAIVFGLFVGAFVGLVVGSSLSGVLAGVLSAAAATWLGAIDWSKVVAPIRMKIKYMPKSNLTPRLKAVGMALLGFAKGIMMVIYWIIYAVLYVAISPLRYIYRIFTNKEIRTMFYVSFLYPAIFATTIGAILLTDCFGLAEPWNACAVALLCVLGIIVLLEDGGLITLIWQHFEVATFTKKALEDWFDHDSQSCEPLEKQASAVQGGLSAGRELAGQRRPAVLVHRQDDLLGAGEAVHLQDRCVDHHLHGTVDDPPRNVALLRVDRSRKPELRASTLRVHDRRRRRGSQDPRSPAVHGHPAKVQVHSVRNNLKRSQQARPPAQNFERAFLLPFR